MNIAIIDSICDSGTPGLGGISDINWRLAMELKNSGDKVTVIGAYNKNDNKSLHKEIRIINIYWARMKKGNIIKKIIYSFALAYSAKRLKNIDIYHVPDSITAAALCIFGIGKRVVWHGHSNVLHHSQHGIPWDKSMYYLMKISTSIAARYISRVIALGPSLVQWWVFSGFSMNKISIVPNSIDINECDDKTYEKINFIDNYSYTILYVGRISPEKGGYDEMINAIKNISDKIKLKLIIVGDGSYKKNLEDLVRDYSMQDIVVFAGHQNLEDLQKFYDLADLVILPSRGEMMPRVMLEAWASGKAFMANSVGAIPDYLIDNQNGFLLNSLELNYFCERLLGALENDDLRIKVSKGGMNTVKDLSWNKSTKTIRYIYKSVLKEISTQK